MNVREWALPVYTILIQLAVGALFVLWVIRSFADSKFSPREVERIIRNPILVIVLTVTVAMGGAHFHLSKPFHSFLAVLNFKSSWLSREIVFTVLFFLATSFLWFLSRYKNAKQQLITWVGWVAILVGFSIIYCMARIYLIPTQAAWNSKTILVSFYVTTLLLGSMTIACLLVLDFKFAEIQKTADVEIRSQVIQDSIFGLALIALLSAAADIIITLYQIYLLDHGDSTAQTSLRLLLELYVPLLTIRFFLLVFAPLWFVHAVNRIRKSVSQDLFQSVYMSCLLILIGEIVGRFLFYATHVRVGI